MNKLFESIRNDFCTLRHSRSRYLRAKKVPDAKIIKIFRKIPFRPNHFAHVDPYC